mmetsp:Transcript_135899/g.434777  ORF Transcript_135899/g.434777 Transcript_135899/m.434777 type:complete len:217 (-) Transcript_135899:324-974(-)
MSMFVPSQPLAGALELHAHRLHTVRHHLILDVMPRRRRASRLSACVWFLTSTSDCASHRACCTSRPRRWCSCRSHPRAAHLALKSFQCSPPASCTTPARRRRSRLSRSTQNACEFTSSLGLKGSTSRLCRATFSTVWSNSWFSSRTHSNFSSCSMNFSFFTFCSIFMSCQLSRWSARCSPIFTSACSRASPISSVSPKCSHIALDLYNVRTAHGKW